MLHRFAIGSDVGPWWLALAALSFACFFGFDDNNVVQTTFRCSQASCVIQIS
jgi:hypothetical protein